MVVTRNQTAPEPLALLRALVHGNASMAHRLLVGSGADQLALVAPVGNFTVLHAAVLGGCAALLPQLAAACASAGVPVDAALQLGDAFLEFPGAAPVLELLRSWGIQRPQHWPGMHDGATPLSVAVSCQNPTAIHELLQAGARPAASPMVADAVSRFEEGCDAQQMLRLVLRLLLDHGLDPLGSGEYYAGQPLGDASLLVGCHSDKVASVMLAHLEAQRAAGSLQLGSKQRCAQLLVGACRIRDPRPQLGSFGLSQLEQLVAGGQDADTLSSLLLGVAAAGNPAVLSALLASQLPWDLTAAEEPNVVWYDCRERRGYSLLALAATSPQSNACVRLLYEAGAVPTATDLYCAIDSLCPCGVAALLAYGIAEIDTSQPSAAAPLLAGPPSLPAWSCPIHRTLHALCALYPWEPPKHKAVLQVLEALRAAGVRPTVYTNAALPKFTRPSENRVLPVLDPFDFYDVEWCRQRGLPVARRYTSALPIPPRVLFAARDGSWSPDTHHHWPAGLKAAARAFLLVANQSSSSMAEASSSQRPRTTRRRQHGAVQPSNGQQPGCTLGALPPELLLRIVKAAAEPLSAWL